MNDWLDTEERVPAHSVSDTPLVPAIIELPVAGPSRDVVVREAWARLADNQRLFLTTLRQNGFNARKAARALEITGPGRESHISWMHQADYSTVFRAWRAWAAGEAKDPDHLLTRQDHIVEELLAEKDILHQGVPTGFHENQAGPAARANETLMKAAGLLKDKEVEINVGISVGPPTLNIQVMPTPPSKVALAQNVAIDAKFTEVPDDEWLGT